MGWKRGKKQGSGVRSRQSGQVAVLFALIFTFMFVLFAFVVDFSHLVNNKINLQIAADQAAYAGAAWQARILNRISMVNYKLRQNVKEMAMRINVTHLRHNRNFPRGTGFINGGDQAHQTEPFICQQAHGYTAISGLKYAQDTNLCRNASPSVGGLPPIVVPPVIASFDPFAVAIAAQIRRIQQAANQECRAAAVDNKRLAEHLRAVYTRRSDFHSRQVLALSQYLNSVANEDPQSSNHPLVKTAYETAKRNLSYSNEIDNGGFKMEILHPQGGQYLQLKRNLLNATIFYINFQVEGNGCVGRPNYLDFNDMVAGYYKVPSIVTYFAVKLSSKPRLLFMPSRWVENVFPNLEAFAAAKPFGSRIGPEPSADPLLPIPQRVGNQNRMINFSTKPRDELGILNTKLMAFYDALHPFNGMGRPEGNRQRGWPMPQSGRPGRDALRAIRAPTVFDAIFYTIFPDPGPNKDQDYLQPRYARALYPDYLEAADYTSDRTLGNSPPRTPPYFPGEVGSKNRGSGWIQINADDTGVGGPYRGYAEESISSHSVTSALGLPFAGSPDQLKKLGFASPDLIHSAWAPQGKPGRIGYSVKFIGMDALVRSYRVRYNDSGTMGPIQNPPEGDPNIQNIRH